jgi:hypothetical protein
VYFTAKLFANDEPRRVHRCALARPLLTDLKVLHFQLAKAKSHDSPEKVLVTDTCISNRVTGAGFLFPQSSNPIIKNEAYH